MTNMRLQRGNRGYISLCTLKNYRFFVFFLYQGFAVFVFHVVRHDKVWKKIHGTYSKQTDALKSKIISSARSTVSYPYSTCLEVIHVGLLVECSCTVLLLSLLR